MEARVVLEDDWRIEVSWEGWITFGEFMHGVFDALSTLDPVYYCYPKEECRKNHDDVCVTDGQHAIEIVPKGRHEMSSNFAVAPIGEMQDFDVKLARIGIRTVEHIDRGRFVRETTIYGVDWNECGYILCLPPFPNRKK